MTLSRTFFFRCPDCGGELLHTVDLELEAAPTELPACHCGALMLEAKIPRLVIPEPGGDGHTYEVEVLER